MPTNLALDDQLIEEARRAGKHKTKKEAVNAALDEYVRKRKQMRILKAFGTFPGGSCLRLQSRAEGECRHSEGFPALPQRLPLMMVLVDTPLWSLALRRRSEHLSPEEQQLTQALAEL